jgi:phospholipid/cholesterol/gamma-HCH transport system permease protein
MTAAPESIKYDPNTRRLICQGEWSLATFPQLKKILKGIQWPTTGKVIIDGKGITKLDSSGAWLLILGVNEFAPQLIVEFESLSEPQQKLVDIIQEKIPDLSDIPAVKVPNLLARIGKTAILQMMEVRDYLAFIGELAIEGLRLMLHPSKMRWPALASIVEDTGFNALFIVGLLSLMIGIVITYQMGLQLRNYGANIYIVDLLGLSVLREFAPLITAIIVAGRTGSAFAAQLGTMKVNQEIDALNTMGVKPAVLLLLPRLIGLMVALPLLTIWADFFGVFGGMAMSNNMLDITWYNFVHRFQHVISLKTLLIGLGKAPVFALLIASIGCFEGMKVQGSADSVGKHTTKSVVLSIFAIIVVDAIFSVLLSKLKL